MAQRDEHPMAHIASMAGGIMETVQQLEGLARIMRHCPATVPGSTLSDADFAHTMSLFAEQLDAVRDGLQDIHVTANDACQFAALHD
jgi:hypothetical protein